MSITKRESYMMGTTPPTVSANMPAVVGLKNVWTSQPQIATEVDWSNPITRGLVFAQNGNDSINIATNTRLVKYGNPKTTIRSNGAGLQCASGDYYTSPALMNTFTSGQTYLTIIERAEDSTPDKYIFVKGTPPGGSIQIGISADFYTNKVGITVGVQSSYENRADELVKASVGDINTYVALFSNSNGYLYKNGVYQSSTVTGPYEGSFTGDIYVGTSAAAPITRTWTGGIFLSLVWNRTLSESEIRSVSQNPWQIFRPLTKQIWVPA